MLAVEPDHPDWEFHYLHCTAAPPGGLVEPAAFASISQRILAGLNERKWDAVYLSLHGAMAPTRRCSSQERAYCSTIGLRFHGWTSSR